VYSRTPNLSVLLAYAADLLQTEAVYALLYACSTHLEATNVGRHMPAPLTEGVSSPA
jgi:hypothetical protein